MPDNQFYPSNGTEGEIFFSEFCDKCYKKYGCTILTNSLIGKKPKQWIYKDDNPVCTSFFAKRPRSIRIQRTDNSPKLFI